MTVPASFSAARVGLDFNPVAGLIHAPRPVAHRRPRVLVFDSGLGGLTVFREILRARPDADFTYCADDAAFPYGRLDEATLIARMEMVMERLVDAHRPDCVVIACNTASTLALPRLRARFAPAFVGTVPAVKPACEASRSRRVSILATPGTVKRDYTRALIDVYGQGCAVTLVGAARLASLAEAAIAGDAPDRDGIAAEIAPCFVDDGGARTDAVVLACTHYPLLIEEFRALAPWPVDWIDPAPAVARRVAHLIGPETPAGADRRRATAILTGGADVVRLRAVFEGFGLPKTLVDPLPLH